MVTYQSHDVLEPDQKSKAPATGKAESKSAKFVKQQCGEIRFGGEKLTATWTRSACLSIPHWRFRPAVATLSRMLCTPDTNKQQKLLAASVAASSEHENSEVQPL